MTIREAEYLIAVAEYGSVTEAARSLSIAQPSLSRALVTLERRLGTALFDRTDRGLRITDAGRAITGTARRILADVDRIRSAAADVRAVRSGVLTISVVNALAAQSLPALVGRFHRRHPGVRVVVVAADGIGAVTRAVRDGRCDVGLTETPVDDPTLALARLPDDETVLALHPDRAAGLPSPVPVERLVDVPMVVLTGSTPPVAVPWVAVECEHRRSVWELVAQGAGGALVPRGLARRELPGIDIRSLHPPIPLRTGLLYRDDSLTPAAAAFVAMSTNARPADDSRARSATSP